MTSTLAPPSNPATPEVPGSPPDSDTPTGRGRVARLLRGAPDDPSWNRPALLALLSATAVLYIWNLSASG